MFAKEKKKRKMYFKNLLILIEIGKIYLAKM